MTSQDQEYLFLKECHLMPGLLCMWIDTPGANLYKLHFFFMYL